MARIRNLDYNTVHHLTSRIAHRVYFLKDEERNDFVNLMLRVSAFSGIEPLGWCIMHNHFHIFAYLPVPPTLSDEEVLHRFSLLKEDSGRLFADEADDLIPMSPFTFGAECQTPRGNSNVNKVGAECQTPRAKFSGEELIRSIRRRMYSIAEYMRMIKKWFSDDYNLRNGHKGTMWEAVYGDRALPLPENPGNFDDLLDILAYIHLNPIRAAITDRFDTYAWSSYSAFKQGDPTAVTAIRRLYPGMSNDEIISCHERRMGNLLESWKLKRAKEIANKRIAGYEIPADPLTDECMIAQAIAHAKDVQKALEQLHAERDLVKGAKERHDIICKQIQYTLELHPDFSPSTLSSVLNVPTRTLQRYLAAMRKDGTI